MFCSGAGAQPAGLRLQSERRERVQHGPVHPAAGRGGTGSERRQDTRGFYCSVLTRKQHGITINNCFRQLCAKPSPFSSYRTLPLSSFTLSASQVGDQIVEINGEATQGITHTRAIELIQAGGNKVHLLLRPGQGLVPDHSE